MRLTENINIPIDHDTGGISCVPEKNSVYLGVNPEHVLVTSISSFKQILSPAQTMKSLILLLPLLANAAPSLERRQLGIFTQAPGAPVQPIKITKQQASLYDDS